MAGSNRPEPDLNSGHESNRPTTVPEPETGEPSTQAATSTKLVKGEESQLDQTNVGGEKASVQAPTSSAPLTSPDPPDNASPGPLTTAKGGVSLGDMPPSDPQSAAPAPPQEMSQIEPHTSDPKKSDSSSNPAMGPSLTSEEPAPETSQDSSEVLLITLLLTTGARHPFKIDSKYLRKREVEVDNYDPYAISGYKLKELILREWRQEWEPQPSSPTSIRLIHMGKMLEDSTALSEARFGRTNSNIVHMTVRPQEVVDEEENAKAANTGTNQRDDSERSPSCRCIIL